MLLGMRHAQKGGGTGVECLEIGCFSPKIKINIRLSPVWNINRRSQTKIVCCYDKQKLNVCKDVNTHQTL